MDTRRSSNESMHYMLGSVHIHQHANEIDISTNERVLTHSLKGKFTANELVWINYSLWEYFGKGLFTCSEI